MRCAAPHRWDLDTAEARALQQELAEGVSLADETGSPRLVTGVDVAFDKAGGRAFAAAVTMRIPELEPIEESFAEGPLGFPYIPGLLSFREGPVALRALEGLRREPDLLVFDGQGIAHPRRLGLASHLGVVTGMPSIGAAKSRYVGEYEEPEEEKGSWRPLLLEGDEVGRVLRTRPGVRPVFVSPGHRISVERAADLVLSFCPRYRIPEPTRAADRMVAREKRRRTAG